MSVMFFILITIMSGVFAKYSMVCNDTIEIGIYNEDIPHDPLYIYVTFSCDRYLDVFNSLRSILIEKEKLIMPPNTFTNTRRNIQELIMDAYFRVYDVPSSITSDNSIIIGD